MMKTGVVVLSVVAPLFGVASAVLGFIAERRKLAPRDIEISRNECVYPTNPAFALGLVAALLLLLAQIGGSAVGGCCGFWKPRGPGLSGEPRVIASAISVISWVAALIAERSFLQGAVRNAPGTRETSQGQGCSYAKEGVFSMAAIVSIFATLLGFISSILFCTTGDLELEGPSSLGEGDTKHDGITIGQPAASQQQHAQAV